ncbi:unnamed protein product [Mytilus coruscus]|uniref:Reverse transcriptase domain-containing protein n=1 Tax=Mytilus coruscus TaxID=42192 RepID=A0A6J8CGC3_MYTCO|nr:unnamed protein product [Mytilus coruscus]
MSNERNQSIPWSIIDDEGIVKTDKNLVLGKWKSDFEQLFSVNPNVRPPAYDNETRENQPDVTELNEPISREEIIVAVERAKLRKATGFDEIPAEVLKNPTAIDLLHLICNGCFELGKVPDQWTKGIINPIFKCGSDTRNNPLNYRGITLTSVPSKIYCHVLNARLSSWLDDNDILCDEQNGFREKRSCEEHIYTLHTIINDHITYWDDYLGVQDLRLVKLYRDNFKEHFRNCYKDIELLIIMASRRNSRNQPYSNRHLDLNNPDNWTSQQLRIKLQQLGIVVPKNVAKTVLKQFYLENKDRQNSNGNIALNEEHVSDPEHVVLNPIAQHSGSASALAPDSTANVTDGLRNPTADESSSRSDVNESTGSAQFDSVGGNNMAAIIQSFSIVSQSVAQCASGLQQTVSLIANQKSTESGPAKKFDLAQWYQNRNMEDVPLAVHGSVQNRPTLPLSTTPSLGYLSTTVCPTAGVRSDAFSNVDIVAPSLQRSIIEGKDVNLGALLIPNFESPVNHSIIADGVHVNLANKADPRLNRHLSIQEFIQAFGKFKRIMCGAYPDRRVELDAYEVNKLWSNAVAMRTRAVYETGYNHFKTFLLLNGVNLNGNKLPPISEELLIYFVAFHGFLRCGEFTVDNASNFDSESNLCVSDVTFYEDFAILHLKQSKTDPFRKGIDIQLHRLNNILCPYTTLKNYLQLRSVKGKCALSDPLFIMENFSALERKYFITNLKILLEACGYQAVLYNGHSFRIGAATSAGKANIEDHLIKTLGRWSSDSYCRYVRTDKSSIKNAQQQICNS